MQRLWKHFWKESGRLLQIPKETTAYRKYSNEEKIIFKTLHFHYDVFSLMETLVDNPSWRQ